MFYTEALNVCFVQNISHFYTQRTSHISTHREHLTSLHTENISISTHREHLTSLHTENISHLYTQRTSHISTHREHLTSLHWCTSLPCLHQGARVWVIVDRLGRLGRDNFHIHIYIYAFYLCAFNSPKHCLTHFTHLPMTYKH